MSTKQPLMSPEEWAHRLATDPVVRALAEHLSACLYVVNDKDEFESAVADWSVELLVGSGLVERGEELANDIYNAQLDDEDEDELPPPQLRADRRATPRLVHGPHASLGRRG